MELDRRRFISSGGGMAAFINRAMLPPQSAENVVENQNQV